MGAHNHCRNIETWSIQFEAYEVKTYAKADYQYEHTTEQCHNVFYMNRITHQTEIFIIVIRVSAQGS
jgi:hypothetical protein